MFPDTFVTFPTNAVTIDFSNDPGAKNKPLQTRTQDGLPVTIEIALQYKLKPVSTCIPPVD